MATGSAPMSASAAAALSADFYGWDLLYKTIEREVKNKKADVLIALAHFILTKHYKMKCLGIGEDKTLSEDEEGSELLPDGWNGIEQRYSLRYLHKEQLYLLLGHPTEDFVTMNLLNVKQGKVSNLTIKPEDVVKKIGGSILQMIPDISIIASRYRRELVEPVFTGNTREVTTQTINLEDPPQPRQSVLVEPMQQRGRPWPPVEPRPFGFPHVGSGDLDPLARGGPGNLFPLPLRPDFNRMNPRFEPFGPDGRLLRADPNPDHLPPPNYNADYYM